MFTVGRQLGREYHPANVDETMAVQETQEIEVSIHRPPLAQYQLRMMLHLRLETRLHWQSPLDFRNDQLGNNLDKLDLQEDYL